MELFSNLSDTSLLGIAFAVWAVVVAYGVQILAALRRDVKNMALELHNYVVRTEARLAVLEDRAKRNDAIR